MANGLDTFDTDGRARAAVGLVAQLNPLDSFYTGDPFFSNRATFDTPQEILDAIKQFAFAGREPEHDRGLVPDAGVHQVAAAAVDRTDHRADRLHARLRESVSRFGCSGCRYRLFG